MKARKEAARFAERQLHWKYKNPREKFGHFHYGLQDLRELLDFIYGGKPRDPESCVQKLGSQEA